MPASVDKDAPLDLLGLAIDRKADVPIGVQIAWALRGRIAEGRLAPGRRLPGIRELAEATGVNVNTARAVYQRLEQDGLIDRQQGSGTFVAATPRSGAALSSIAERAAEEARETGLDPRDVAAALYVAQDDVRGTREAEAARDDPDGERSQAARRRTLRTQIATLERTIAELEADHRGVAPPSRRTRRGIGPTLLSVEELAQVRAELIRRLAVVQTAIDEHVEQARLLDAVTTPTARATRKSSVKTEKRSSEDAEQARTPASRVRPTTRPAPAS
ncbi:MAG TPA: GntR family transcriptional regulator [Solirubrobacteraceae bacterium]|jgi:DNA-binding transcriptional regulator YhcF (GntR family)|nr:GntR family transcriptional regulator [Solirubrobacteraceae bacterium]